jgi:hypothetical protein
MTDPIAENRADLTAQAISAEARMPTPTEIALLEYGKQVLLKSVDTAIDFHKTMLGVSATFGTLITTATPVLIWGSKDAKIPMPQGWLLIVPPLLMLLSSVVFAVGYYPRYLQFNPNVIDDVRAAREQILASRGRLARLGLGLFCVSLLSLTVLVLWLRRH